jgi:hypothetical protein
MESRFQPRSAPEDGAHSGDKKCVSIGMHLW